jgi:hypothetical protein
VGGSNKQTIGYHYRWAQFFGWCKGTVDAVLAVKFGGVLGWVGRATESTRISINKPGLWGGEDGEGGAVGEMDLMFGESDQAPNDYLSSVFGPQQSGNRGKFTTLWRGGRFGAFVPNPKTTAVKVERILADGPLANGEQWYPEKAVIEVAGEYVLPPDATGWEYQILDEEADPGFDNLVAPSSGWSTGQGPFSGGTVGGGNTSWPVETVLWARRTVDVPGSAAWTLFVRAENGCVVLIDGVVVGAVNQINEDIDNNQNNTFTFTLSPGPKVITVKAFDEAAGAGGGTFLSIEIYIAGTRAMNPVHMIYESLVHPDMQGEPSGLIHAPSFEAAADACFDAGFGLCTEYDSDAETPEQFRQRIMDILGGGCGISRIDGLYHLDLAWGQYDLDALPTITDADLLAYERDDSEPTESVNSVRVEWYDPEADEDRSTAPIVSLGAIRTAGEVIPEVLVYKEIPTAVLATRVGKRYLDAKSKRHSRFNLSVGRKFRGLRPGVYVRLQLPLRGIADTVCLAGSVEHGTHVDGRIKLRVVQDLAALPTTVYIGDEPGLWVPPSTSPTPASYQGILESPYLELASSMPPADLAAVAEDSGFLLTAAVRPAAGGINYGIQTAAAAEEYVARGRGEWCPSVATTAAHGPTVTTLDYTGGQDLDRAALGTWVLWDNEICRLDALDTVAETITLGRGCGDTAPALAHASGSRIHLCGDWVSTDEREYVDGDVVRAKLLTRLSSAELDLSSAPELTVTMDQRQLRPYPPGRLRLTDSVAPDQAYPVALVGEITVEWAHRDRVLQADQVVDETATDIGPEPSTTYSVRYYLDDVLEETETGLTGTAATAYTFPADGLARIEVEAVRDGLTSWQAAIAEFNYSVVAIEALLTEANDTFVTEAGDRLILE